MENHYHNGNGKGIGYISKSKETQKFDYGKQDIKFKKSCLIRKTKCFAEKLPNGIQRCSKSDYY